MIKNNVPVGVVFGFVYVMSSHVFSVFFTSSSMIVSCFIMSFDDKRSKSYLLRRDDAEIDALIDDAFDRNVTPESHTQRISHTRRNMDL